MRLRLGVAGLLAFAAVGYAQQVGNLDAPPAKPKSYVVYAAEQQSVSAGKRSVLELHFRVVDGFHVNSHTPKSELLIPTRIELQPAAGVKADAIEYPAGTSYSFSFDPTEKLDVYSGDFTVKLPVVAEAGTHTVDGTLRYQACDHAACYPPKSLPLQVIFTAK
ncbi:protein-disulfide reductase DsbD N-terminal domain-containing protein [Tunturiibacter lichenicola]|uniref:protein-disulfide reductase DsbD N-terminal domain-containing protein n=1 Tax=Tunturiibacter lichenicola TaxID=2051959 RepID=UPI0021B1C8D8|nr:protein-disulfide reductase DsbD N-terminal domain-containing protein [Edaphobacter lichenicola]